MGVNLGSYGRTNMLYGGSSPYASPLSYANPAASGAGLMPMQNTALPGMTDSSLMGGGGNSMMGMMLQLISTIVQMLSALMPMMGASGGSGSPQGSGSPMGGYSPSMGSGSSGYSGGGLPSGSSSPYGSDSSNSGGSVPTPSGSSTGSGNYNPAPTGSPSPGGANPTSTGGSDPANSSDPTNPTDPSVVAEVGGNAGSVRNGPGVQLNPNSNLPPIDPSQWTARDGSNGGPFTTPFSSSNVIKNGNTISTQLKGGQGAEAQYNKTIGTGFYQVHLNPHADDQKGDNTTFFLYSGTGSQGTPKQQGFELDAEYNLTKPGTVTFGTWIDGEKHNEVTVDAPKGGQTIGFNIQPGKTQIGYVNPDGTFNPVSETNDPRITAELASHLKPMTNSWRMQGTSDNGQTSSITIDGFGRSDAPGQPVTAV